ncbi:outer membrane beta-barrel family protein [Flagellimonas allohymeniacidonis]|uniref:Outer membrane protein beta-barrel domain-containing protein n=1 Tax=Flagellimonas allohymeniacidonis TaxID=2517819 RepID=A0A4Q8Q9L6_9FLAO|nr:outer membrane beta-barrel family protein [Allomuricauda hymeniacidonis]TAI46911.1 hypothetical protein EW142_09420 [Allomuricauda hymeniacidonis]
MKHHAFFFVLVFAPLVLFGQYRVKVHGNVTDPNGNPISIADVLLYDADEQNLLAYTTVSNGTFVIEAESNEDYSLQISALGFKTKVISIFLDSELELDIALEESATALEEVEVVATQNPVSNTNGNIKINVQHPVFSSIPDPLEVLSKLPGIQIAADRESLSLLGKGNPLIYMNNQRVDFEALIGLSVDAIETIELIQNPSAKYEASGRAVLLITTKRNMSRGLTGTLQETASWKRNFNNYLNTNASWVQTGFEINANLALNHLATWESNAFQFNIPTADIFSDYEVLIPRNNRTQLNSGLGFYLPISDQGSDYLSFNSVLRIQTDDFPIETETLLQIRDSSDAILTDTGNENTNSYFSGNLNFNKSIEKDFTFFFGLQYSTFNRDFATDIRNNRNNSGFELEQLRNQDFELNSLAMRIDFEHGISKNSLLEFGGNWNEARANAFSDIQILQPPQTTIFDFGYQESLYAGYVSFSGKLSPKMDFSGGLRTEYNRVGSELTDESVPLIERENTRLFPRASLNVTIDSTKTVSLNYARSITRPNFSRTTTITTFINPVLEGAGNINLLPEITDELSANLQWQSKSLTVGYYKTQFPMNFTIGFDAETQNAILSQVNLDNASGFYATANLPMSKGIWTSNTTLSVYYNQIEDEGSVLGEARPYGYFYTNHQFKVAKDTTIALGGWGLTKRREGIFQRNSILFAEASINKNFGKKLLCSLRFNDIFRQLNFEEAYTIDQVESDGVFIADGHEIALSVKYSFGTKKEQRFQNKNVDENIERIN